MDGGIDHCQFCSGPQHADWDESPECRRSEIARADLGLNFREFCVLLRKFAAQILSRLRQAPIGFIFFPHQVGILGFKALKFALVLASGVTQELVELATDSLAVGGFSRIEVWESGFNTPNTTLDVFDGQLLRVPFPLRKCEKVTDLEEVLLG